MNPDLTPGPPGDGQKPIEQLFRDVFALADETAQRITDTDVDARLDQLLRKTGRAAPPSPEPDPAKVLDAARQAEKIVADAQRTAAEMAEQAACAAQSAGRPATAAPGGGQSPGVEAGPEPDAARAGPTSVDLPVQDDQTIAVQVRASLRAAADHASSRPAAGTDDRATDDVFGFSGSPGQTWGWSASQAREAPAPGSASQPWGAAFGSAGGSWGAGPWGSDPAGSAGGSWGAAPAGRAGQPPEPASAWGAAPAWAATPPGGAASATQAGVRHRRTALVLSGVVVLMVAVAVGLLAFHALHRAATTSTASNQTGSSGSTGAGFQAATRTPESPAAAVAGPASTRPAPAGYRTLTVPASESNTTAGFTMAVPDGWGVSPQGTGIIVEAPGGTAFLQIDLIPHTSQDMIAEARYLAAVTQRQGKFPGYTGQIIRPINLRGGAGAAWAFTWLDPSLGRVRALDLMYDASTLNGRQSYSLYLSSVATAWTSNLGVFDEAMRTFRPIP